MTDTEQLETERPLRRDAALNRERILAAAKEIFAESGLDAGYDEIARRAGVGVGTVYRRFPERAEMVEALFLDGIGEMVELAADAAREADPWTGLASFLEKSLTAQVSNRGLKEALGDSVGGIGMSIARDRLVPAIEALLTRAKEAGAVRVDIEVTDLGIMTSQLSSISTDDQPDLWRRYLALLLDAIRADGEPAQPLPFRAPSDETVTDLMHRATHHRSTR